jgi:hypothetical protein
MSHITNETNIISILEIQGIKFTSRNFQIEMELKQVMVLNNEPIFNSCLIKTSKSNNTIENTNETKPLERKIENVDNTLESQKQTPISLDNLNILEDNLEDSLEDILDIDLADNNKVEDVVLSVEENINEIDNSKKPALDNEINIELDFEDLDEENNEDNDELKEVNINTNLENTLESIQLKKPNQVYFELYVEARKKAKDAKKNAIMAYLEVKNIKKTYMIDNTIDSDSDFDAEIDEVSESELENL